MIPSAPTVPVSEREERNNFQLSREPERLSKESVDMRSRGILYDLPDYDNLNVIDSAVNFNLIAPPPRIDSKWGKMVQHWCNPQINDGARLPEMLKQGWRVRHPDTVDPSFPHYTQKWQGSDVIGVSKDAILMEMPASHHKKLMDNLLKKNQETTSAIRQSHGNVMRDGQWGDDKLDRLPKFAETVEVERKREGGEINFAD